VTSPDARKLTAGKEESMGVTQKMKKLGPMQMVRKMPAAKKVNVQWRLSLALLVALTCAISSSATFAGQPTWSAPQAPASPGGGAIQSTARHDTPTHTGVPPAAAHWPSLTARSGSASVPSTVQLHVNWPAIGDTGHVWVEPAVAVGPTRLVAAVDDTLGEYFDPKQGNDQIGNNTFTLESYLGGLPVGSGFQIFQPQWIWDQYNGITGLTLTNPDGRYVFVAVANRPSDQKSWMVIHTNRGIGYIEGTDLWCDFGFDAELNGQTATNNFAMNPRIGVTSNALVIAANMYSYAAGSFQYDKLWVLDKSYIYNDNCPNRFPASPFWAQTNADRSAALSLVPAQTFGDSTTLYLVNAYDPGSGTANKLTLWKLDTTNLRLTVRALRWGT
jgi:hypothetical protein